MDKNEVPTYKKKVYEQQVVSALKMIEESVLVWLEVKKAAPFIIKGGGNPIEVLIVQMKDKN